MGGTTDHAGLAGVRIPSGVRRPVCGAPYAAPASSRHLAPAPCLPALAGRKTAMTTASRCSRLALLVVLSLLGHGDALFGRGKGGGGGGAGGGGGGGGGGAVVSGNTKLAAAAAAKIDPEALHAAAGQASERVMMWGTTTIFQLKAAVQLKGQVERLQAAANRVGGKTMLKMDPAMYKEVMGGALGGVFLMLNSPNMGKVSDMAKALMKDQRRQVRVVDLDQKVQESFAAGKGKNLVTKGPKGFLEGALLNKEVAAAHDKFMADIEALSSSALAKKVGASAEAYHDALLVYATNEPANAAGAAAGAAK